MGKTEGRGMNIEILPLKIKETPINIHYKITV
jgi:hypothetical protein